MARKGATRSDPGRRPGTPPAAVVGAPGFTRAELWLLTAIALAAALSGVILYVHAQIAATRGTYTSFCNISSRINCDIVLTSPFSALFGVPVAVWALLTYAALAALVLVRHRTTDEIRARATLLLVALGLWSAVFSVYMAGVAAWAIRTLCLLCSGLYILNATIAVLAWRIARAHTPAGAPLLTMRRLVIGGAAVAVALAAASTAQLIEGSAALANWTPADVQARKPDFYKWYTTRPVAAALPAAEHVRGAADAPITIVEFSDFECAYCAKAFRDLRDLEQRHPGTLRVVFHHFPLDPDCNSHVPTRVHRSACIAAIAAECAARFGKFWELHDRLFANQERLGRDDLIATAADLGIDRDAFAACLDDATPRNRVVADTAAGARLGVTSTPTLFINGRTIEGALDRDAYDYVLALERHG